MAGLGGGEEGVAGDGAEAALSRIYRLIKNNLRSMEKIKLIAFACLFCALLQAQDTNSRQLLALKFSPLALLNVQTACIQPGIELRFLPNWGLQADYGFQYERFSLMDWNYKRKDWKYHKVKTELRHYLPFTNKRQVFIGLEYFNIKQQYRKLNDLVTLSDGILYSYDQSDIKRNSWGLLTKYGFILWEKNHFFSEISIGAGFKKINISHDLMNPMEDNNYHSNAEHFPNKDEKEGDWTTLAVSFEIKFGYNFLTINHSK